jgi:hypothetical protein
LGCEIWDAHFVHRVSNLWYARIIISKSERRKVEDESMAAPDVHEIGGGTQEKGTILSLNFMRGEPPS